MVRTEIFGDDMCGEIWLIQKNSLPQEDLRAEWANQGKLQEQRY